MASVIDICNRALSRAGANNTIQDLTEDTAEADLCDRNYASCRDEVLEDYAFNFAQRVVTLAVVSGVTVPGWGYVYRYPIDCLMARVITDEMGQRLPADVFRHDIWEFDWITRRMPFQVMADPVTDGAKIIVTDMPNAYLWYTKRVEDPNQFSALFRSALAWKLGMELALGLKAGTQLAQNCDNKYRGEISLAQAKSLNESVPDRPPASPTIQARN
jgi:hypothetical protein